MIKKIFKSIFLTINIVILISPFALIAYHIYVFFQTGNITLLPLNHAVYDITGLDLKFQNTFQGILEKPYEIYLSIIRLPLLLWLFILAIPSFFKLYREI